MKWLLIWFYAGPRQGLRWQDIEEFYGYLFQERYLPIRHRCVYVCVYWLIDWLIPKRTACSLYHFMMVFGMTRPGRKPKTYRVRGGHANHWTTRSLCVMCVRVCMCVCGRDILIVWLKLKNKIQNRKLWHQTHTCVCQFFHPWYPKKVNIQCINLLLY